MLFEDIQSHREMLTDETRTRSYERAIANTIRPGHKVLDFGCGTGIMSFFAARSGAEKVFAVDRSRIIRVAKEIAKKNNLSNVAFYHDDENSLSLAQKVDLIIWEGMGSMVVDEWSVKSLLAVRDRFLGADGTLIPSKISLFGGLVCDESMFATNDYFNQKPYGMDFSPVGKWLFNRVSKVHLEKKNVLLPHIRFGQMDLYTLKEAPSQLTGSVVLNEPTVIHGICGWFEAELAPGIVIDTGPESPPTHWGQLFFPLEEPFTVPAKREITVNVQPNRTADGEGIFWVWSISDGEKAQQLDSFFHVAWLTRPLQQGLLK